MLEMRSSGQARFPFPGTYSSSCPGCTPNTRHSVSRVLMSSLCTGRGEHYRTQEDCMSIESRLRTLEAQIGPAEPVTIRVCRLPPEAMALDGQEQRDWIEAHPACVDRIIEVPGRSA